jgi:hypothetical protein
MTGSDKPPEEVQAEQELQQRLQDLGIRSQEADIAKTEAEALDEQKSAEERESKIILNLATARNTANGVANQQ